jgi:hypothetical protein
LLITVSLHGIYDHLEFAGSLEDITLGFVEVLEMDVEVLFLGKNLLLQIGQLTDALIGELHQSNNIVGRLDVIIITGPQQLRVKEVFLILGGFD